MHDFIFEHDHPVDAHTFDDCCMECAQSLDRLRELLASLHAQIAAHDETSLAALAPDELFQLFLVLDDIAHLEGGERLADWLDTDAEIRTLLPAIHAYYEIFFALHERHLAEAILAASGDPWETVDGFALIARYEGLLANERGLIPARDPALPLVFLGCGSAPVSLFLRARSGGRRAVGIDRDPEAVSLATRCVARLGLADCIEIVEGDETAVGDHTPGAVLIAALAEPKAQIFATLHRLLAGRPETPVLYRTYAGMCTVLHAPVRPDEVVGFTTVRQVKATGRINNTSVLVRWDVP